MKLHYTLYKTSQKERGNKLIAEWAQKYNASKFVLNQK